MHQSLLGVDELIIYTSSVGSFSVSFFLPNLRRAAAPTAARPVPKRTRVIGSGTGSGGAGVGPGGLVGLGVGFLLCGTLQPFAAI